MRVRLEKEIVSNSKPYRRHLKSVKSLVTPYEATRAGFVKLALERSRCATPFVEEARALKVAASQAKTPKDLMKISEIRRGLLTAAGVSGKATGHMQDKDKEEAITELIKKYLAPAGPAFVEELVYRFLLTRGDTLGGSMRNIGGVLAVRKLSRAIISNLTLAGIPYQWLHSSNNTWAAGTEKNADIELNLRGLSWSNRSKTRTLIYNLTVPDVKKNVDICLLNCRPRDYKTAYRKLSLYVALGELKGGIDPAGADEHWKTAGTAFARIRKAFSARRLRPHLFFIGAAIENGMAGEIWRELEEGSLSNAANLTDSNQVASLCRWLCSI
jgi:hypothetical protein